MTKNDIKNIGTLGFTPIIFGGFIYLISRPKTIFIFDWIRIIKLENESNNDDEDARRRASTGSTFVADLMVMPD